MKKMLNKIKFLGILFVILFAFTGYPQTPTYQATLLNDSLVSSTVYEFDIYLLRTDTTEFQLGGCQIGLTFSDNIRNGGTLTATTIPGTCEFSNPVQAPANPNVVTLQGSTRVWKLASKAPPGIGNGSIISNVAPGTRVGRFRLTNTVDFSAVTADFAWTFLSTQYQTKISAYYGGLNQEITTPATHLNSLLNPILPVELTSFNAVNHGREVTLNWETKTELNSSAFVIERQAVNNNPEEWETIGSVSASGTSTTPREYSFTDQKLNSGKYSYRLKMTDNDGTFEYSNVVEVEIALPKDYAISQNYPNPFNPTTRIDYQLPFDSKVNLELYGITGERVATIINSELSAGYYTADINASAMNLASGVYIYRMTAQNPTGQNFVQVKKLILSN